MLLLATGGARPTAQPPHAEEALKTANTQRKQILASLDQVNADGHRHVLNTCNVISCCPPWLRRSTENRGRISPRGCSAAARLASDRVRSRRDRRSWTNAVRQIKTKKYIHNQSICPIDRLTNWSLTALSVQIGHIVPLIRMLQLKSEINNNVEMLRVGNTCNKPLQ